MKKEEPYHYSECGLDNIYLLNGYKFKETPRGQAISINNIDGLHVAIGLFLIREKKELSGNEIRFLRHEMLMSQNTLSRLLGMSEQTIRRWETEKTSIPKSSEYLLRLLYAEHVNDKDGKISSVLRKIGDLEDQNDDEPVHFKDTKKGWTTAA